MTTPSQVTSGTFNFMPSLGEVVLNAYARIGVRRPEILQTHMADARMEANLLLAKISNTQPNLWTVDLQSIPLVQGMGTYSVPAETAMILDVYVRFGEPVETDRAMYPISRSEYSTYPQKSLQAFPTVYWFDRLISPTITIWPVPDSAGPYTLYYYRVRQVQDAEFTDNTNALTIEIPYLWLDAFCAGLAHRLARVYAPNLEQIRKADADEAWALAAKQDQENVGMYVTPGLNGYFRI
jgi:hypothetical protein